MSTLMDEFNEHMDEIVNAAHHGHSHRYTQHIEWLRKCFANLEAERDEAVAGNKELWRAFELELDDDHYSGDYQSYIKSFIAQARRELAEKGT